MAALAGARDGLDRGLERLLFLLPRGFAGFLRSLLRHPREPRVLFVPSTFPVFLDLPEKTGERLRLLLDVGYPPDGTVLLEDGERVIDFVHPLQVLLLVGEILSEKGHHQENCFHDNHLGFLRIS